MNRYNEIQESIKKGEYNFGVSDLTQLAPNEFREISNMLATEIYNGNHNCYKFIKCLKGLDITKLMSTGHRATLSDDNWAVLIANVYLEYPKPSLLDYIVEMASINTVALQQLKIIASARPDIQELPYIIQHIESQKKNTSELIENVNNKTEKFEYFQLDFGAIVKVQKDKFLLYRLDPNTNEWIEDHELYMEMASGSYGYSPITINDGYPYKNVLDQSKGVKL